MSNYQLTDLGMVTSDPVIAVYALDTRISFYDDLNEVWQRGVLLSVGADENGGLVAEVEPSGTCHRRYPTKICIDYPLIADAIKPVKGEACYSFLSSYDAILYPAYHKLKIPSPQVSYISANPITTGKTVGELRELIARVK